MWQVLTGRQSTGSASDTATVIVVALVVYAIYGFVVVWVCNELPVREFDAVVLVLVAVV